MPTKAQLEAAAAEFWADQTTGNTVHLLARIRAVEEQLAALATPPPAPAAPAPTGP